MDTEKQKQRRYNDAMLTESGNARNEQLLVMPASRALEWIGMLKARLVFGYEISDLFLHYGVSYCRCQ